MENSKFPPNHDPRAGLPTEDNQRIRYRIRFGKTGLLRWISHRDLATLWERVGRRVELPFSMTEGFHPKPRIAFPSALALGVQSLDEIVEVELRQAVAPELLLQRLSADQQPGLIIQSVTRLPDGFGKAQLQSSEYIITIPASANLDSAIQAIAELLKKEKVSVERKKKTLTAIVAEQIARLEIRETAESTGMIEVEEDENTSRLHLTLVPTDGASLKPGDVLDLLQLQDWIPDGAKITRTRVVLAKEFETTDPALMSVRNTETLDNQSADPQGHQACVSPLNNEH